VVGKREEDCGGIRPVDIFAGVKFCFLDSVNEEGKKNVTLPATALKLVEEGLGSVDLVGRVGAEGMDAMKHAERCFDLEFDLFFCVFFREEFGSFLLGDFFREFFGLAAFAEEEAFALSSVRPAGFLFCFLLLSFGWARLLDFFDEAPVVAERPRGWFFCSVSFSIVFCILAS
jgi:hypothetical protein